MDLDNSPAKPSDKAAMDVARAGVTVEDEENIVQAIRLDGQDVLSGDIIASVVLEGSVSDSESEDGGDEGAGVGDIAAPPSYAQVSSQSDALESFAESNNDEAVYYARMSFLKAYACKPARQADIREFGSA